MLLIFLVNMLGLFLYRKKSITTTGTFQKTGCKPNRIWVDKSSQFYNKLLKSWLKNNNIEIYSTHNEGKTAAAE